MPRQTVWLRRDPVGSRNLLPSRDEFRARFARRSLAAGVTALASLAILLGLRAADRLEAIWPPLHAVTVVFGIAGIAAAAVAIRGPLRRRALVGLCLSIAAFVGAVVLPTL